MPASTGGQLTLASTVLAILRNLHPRPTLARQLDIAGDLVLWVDSSTNGPSSCPDRIQLAIPLSLLEARNPPFLRCELTSRPSIRTSRAAGWCSWLPRSWSTFLADLQLKAWHTLLILEVPTRVTCLTPASIASAQRRTKSFALSHGAGPSSGTTELVGQAHEAVEEVDDLVLRPMRDFSARTSSESCHAALNPGS